jgi:glycerol-3-phosphate acyltransferase PlsY
MSATALGFATLPAVAMGILLFRKPLAAVAIAVVASIIWLGAYSSPSAVAQQAPTAPAAPPPDLSQLLQHMEKIFSSWATHSNLVALCFVGVVWIVAWMAVKLTKLHVENPRHVYYDDMRRGALEHAPPVALERPRGEAEYRPKLPAISREI